MAVVIVTNNPLVHSRYQKRCEVAYHEVSYRELLVCCRDLIHGGALLLTHPLSGSVKPNETPYKSVALRKQAGPPDADSLRIIEQSIAACDKFGPNRFTLTERLRQDFMLIDDSLLSGTFPEREGI